MGKLDDKTKLEIIFKMKHGVKQRQISRELYISQFAIHYKWKKYMKTGDMKLLSKSGRKQIYSLRNKGLITMKSKSNPFLALRELQNSSEALQKASIWTVRRALNQSLLFCRIAWHKPLLTKIHVKARMDWCTAYKHLLVEYFEKMVFSDESRFETYSSRRRHVRRSIGTRYVNRYVCKTVKFPISVMVWCDIKGDGTKTLVKCPNRLDSNGYQSVLEQGLFTICDSEPVFMQDGTSCHKSRSTLKFLDKKTFASWHTGPHSGLI